MSGDADSGLGAEKGRKRRRFTEASGKAVEGFQDRGVRGESKKREEQEGGVECRQGGGEREEEERGREGAATGRTAVIVWDLDETLIIFNSLLNGKFVQAKAEWEGKLAGNVESEEEEGRRLGEQWERMILTLCDDCFEFDQVRGDFSRRLKMSLRRLF